MEEDQNLDKIFHMTDGNLDKVNVLNKYCAFFN